MRIKGKPSDYFTCTANECFNCPLVDCRRSEAKPHGMPVKIRLWDIEKWKLDFIHQSLT